MAKRTVNNVKLGVFVLAGLLFLVLLLYMIGKNRNLFGKTYVLKARFENVHGLVPGNNVRYSGIQAGTVKTIRILNDTVIEVSMVIDTKMKDIIRKNAVVSIGTDGLVGNKVVNIASSRHVSELAREGDILNTKKSVDTDEMLETLYKTNNDIAVIAGELKMSVQRLNNSNELWSLLNDKRIPQDIRSAAANIRRTTARADMLVGELTGIITNIKDGKGSAGMLLTDSSFAMNLDEAVTTIRSVASKADSLASSFNAMARDLREDLRDGHGIVNSLLYDSLLVVKLNTSLDNIQKGTDGFNQNMEALKHNILFRGFFKKQEKLKKNKE